MADADTLRAEASDAPRDQADAGAPPPPLDAIRVKGPGAKGLNKPAILVAAAGGVSVVLLLASGAFSGDANRQPAETKPMMSDPARPEMAQGAIRSLPTDYTQAAARQEALAPAAPPLLGPPLPGDVAAFAPPQQAAPEVHDNGNDWNTASYAPPEALDPALAEAAAAERSGLFFGLREEPRKADVPQSQQGDPQVSQRSSLTIAAAQDQPAAASRSDRVLFPGAVIPASLVTELNSETPGPVIAQVTQAVHDSATGRILVIPQGARLMGDYTSSTRYGQSRVAITWSRLILPNGDELALEEAAVDPSGAAGVKGQVDNHWGDVFGAAALGTLINIGVATTEDPQLTYGGIGGVTRDPVDAAIADGVQRSASTVTNRVVDRGLAIPPTIRVQSGQRISVIVTRRTSL